MKQYKFILAFFRVENFSKLQKENIIKPSAVIQTDEGKIIVNGKVYMAATFGAKF